MGPAACRRASALGLVLLCVAALAPISTPAQANRKYASVVMAEQSGEILYARNSKSRRYPASLTKVMTLYLLFEELSVGRLTLDSTFTVSSYAARQPPSKLGIKKGQKITVRDAIKALVVRSANDVAVVIAEGIAGSEGKFAKRMTQRARALGMSRTTFRNASGLPNRRQSTTAYDLAILARAISRDFPQYFKFFDTRQFTWGGRKWRTHNHVLKNYKGADGIKTGYTRASGFNLITSAERSGARLIGVVMGGRTPRRRDRDMARILNLTFRRIAKNPGKYEEKLLAGVPSPVLWKGAKPSAPAAAVAPITVARAEPKVELPAVPRLKPEQRPAPIVVADATPVARPDAPESSVSDAPALRTAEFVPEAGDALGARIALALQDKAKGSNDLSGPETPAGAALARARRKATTDGAVAAMTASLSQGDLAIGKQITVPLTAAGYAPNDETTGEGDGVPVYDPDNAIGNRGIQVGAFTQFAQANRHVQETMKLASGALSRGQAAIVPAQTPSGQIYRVRFGPLSDGEAATACTALKGKGLDCFPIQDENWASAIRP